MKIGKVSIALLSAVILTIAGCHHFTGGGWFPGLYGGKAHFGFQMKCADTGEAGPTFPYVFWDGQMQFMDKSAGVRFHGDFIFTVAVSGPASCEEAAEFLADLGGTLYEAQTILGTCRTQPGKVPGTFEMTLIDDGKPGAGAEDFISISTTCTADGSFYTHSGTLGGGNISSIGHHR